MLNFYYLPNESINIITGDDKSKASSKPSKAVT